LSPQLDCVILDASDPQSQTFLDALRGDPRMDNIKLVFAAVENGAFSTPALYDTIVAACIEDGQVSGNGGRLGFVPPRGERILVAEDNEVNRMLVLAQLEELGCGADFVEDGAAAVAASETGLYSLILMDSQMPNMDGLEATAAIRKREATSGGHIAIVCMTANASKNYRDICLAAGMDDYIAKPVLLATLQATVDRWLRTVAS
jgi:CheY-like chemotaxis protein